MRNKLQEIWNQYIKAHLQLREIETEMWAECDGNEKNIVQLLECALKNDQQRRLAIDYANNLGDEARKSLFQAILPYALELETTYHRNKANQFIAGLDRFWVRSQLADLLPNYFPQSILSDEERDRIHCILHLCWETDLELVMEYALLAKKCSDPEIEELGNSYLERLKPKK